MFIDYLVRVQFFIYIASEPKEWEETVHSWLELKCTLNVLSHRDVLLTVAFSANHKLSQFSNLRIQHLCFTDQSYIILIIYWRGLPARGLGTNLRLVVSYTINLPTFWTAWRWGLFYLFDPGLAPGMRHINQQNKLYKNKQESAGQSKVHPNTVKRKRLGYKHRTCDDSWNREIKSELNTQDLRSADHAIASQELRENACVFAIDIQK